mgnify:CR=1 FL=1
MKMTGAQAVIECLKREQVQVVFGYPGGAVLTLYDELYKAKFPHILTGHEQGAVHAADGYARATGKPGVCFATSGPGVCNMVTGIATANMDSIPLVVISGQVATPLIGRDSFQEADISGITTPITKHNYLVKNVKELLRVLKEAFYIAPQAGPGRSLSILPRMYLIHLLNLNIPKKSICAATRVITSAMNLMSTAPSKPLKRQSARSSSPVAASSFPTCRTA